MINHGQTMLDHVLTMNNLEGILHITLFFIIIFSLLFSHQRLAEKLFGLVQFQQKICPKSLTLPTLLKKGDTSILFKIR